MTMLPITLLPLNIVFIPCSSIRTALATAFFSATLTSIISSCFSICYPPISALRCHIMQARAIHEFCLVFADNLIGLSDNNM